MPSSSSSSSIIPALQQPHLQQQQRQPQRRHRLRWVGLTIAVLGVTGFHVFLLLDYQQTGHIHQDHSHRRRQEGQREGWESKSSGDDVNRRPSEPQSTLSSSTSFDYQAYWEHVQEEIEQSLAAIQLKEEEHSKHNSKPTLTNCPKVFMYKLSPEFSDGDPGSSVLRAFGKVIRPPLKYSHQADNSNSGNDTHANNNNNMDDTHTRNSRKRYKRHPGLFHGQLRSTHQFKLARILQHRILSSQHCHTTNPAEADLFWVPLYPNGKTLRQWQEVCQKASGAGMDNSNNSTTTTTTTTTTLDRLFHHQLQPHYNAQTACRHVTVVSKTHTNAKDCRGWWAAPYVHGFEAAQRVAHSHFRVAINGGAPEFFEPQWDGRDPDNENHGNNNKTVNNNNKANAIYPNLVSAPYPSSLHWRANETAPWLRNDNNDKDKSDDDDVAARAKLDHNNRPILMHFMGKIDHGDVAVRREIHRQCVQVYGNDPALCTFHDLHQKYVSAATNQPIQNHNGSITITTNATMENNNNSTTTIHPQQTQSQSPLTQNLFDQWMAEKLQATFCLEPGGDTELRKSISDSLASGCIPVLFSNVTEMAAPWFWREWKAHGRILVPRAPFVAGRIDLVTLLRDTLPPRVLQTMQQTLVTYARQFQYSLDEDAHDGVRILLDGLKRQVESQLDENGNCRV